MNSLILGTVARLLLPLFAFFSFFVLFRGHNEPGGGFIAGLLIASGFALFALAHGSQAATRALVVDPRGIVAFGLLLAVASGLVAPLLSGAPFLTGVWLPFAIPGIGKLSTILVFDIGVYFVVLGASMLVILPLAEE